MSEKREAGVYVVQCSPSPADLELRELRDGTWFQFDQPPESVPSGTILAGPFSAGQVACIPAMLDALEGVDLEAFSDHPDHHKDAVETCRAALSAYREAGK